MDSNNRTSNHKHRAIIICGPTASGKTAYAHAFAMKNIKENIPAEIVNCDSMQVYKQIPIITASPESELTEQLPYHLYNFKDISEDFSVAEYLGIATAKISKILSTGSLPIIVGGTGMYISALINGINHMPDIDLDIRSKVRKMHGEIGAAGLHTELSKYDSVAASKLNPNDAQRIMRALEVVMHTGSSIYEFQQQEKFSPMPEVEFEVVMLSPSRDLLYEMCNIRLAKMFDDGAIEEIASILNSNITFGLSAAKALAVPQIISYLQGDITKKEALEIASAKTRQYAKRQTTWFNNQITKNSVLNFSSLEEYRGLYLE